MNHGGKGNNYRPEKIITTDVGKIRQPAAWNASVLRANIFWTLLSSSLDVRLPPASIHGRLCGPSSVAGLSIVGWYLFCHFRDGLLSAAIAIHHVSAPSNHGNNILCSGGIQLRWGWPRTVTYNIFLVWVKRKCLETLGTLGCGRSSCGPALSSATWCCSRQCTESTRVGHEPHGTWNKSTRSVCH